MEFRTPYNSRIPAKGLVFKEPSRTLQSEYPQTTIDYYLKKYQATGVLGDPTRVNRALYGDFSEVADFAVMQEKINKVKNYFDGLPAEIRQKFGNNANEFCAFVNDPKNKQACFDLGIFVDPAKTPEEVSKRVEEQIQNQQKAFDSAVQNAVKAAPSDTKATD